MSESLNPETARTVRGLLLGLASAQDDAAATEAAQVPYWKPCPHHVIGLRIAAKALRAAAESIPLATADLSL